MLTSLVLSMTLAAPVPADQPAQVAAGPVPRLIEVKAENGKVTLPIIRTEKQNMNGAAPAVPPGGGPAPAVIGVAAISKIVDAELSEIKDLTITTADGKKVTVEEATKKLKDGGTVVISADGKSVSPKHLKVFKDDVLVLASPELIQAIGGRRVPGGVRPLPAPAGGAGAAPGNPGVIQIQIQPGQIQILPALPAPQPAPAPAPEK